jgi:hypothetical protein
MQSESIIVSSQIFRNCNQRLQFRRESRAVAHNAQADPVFVQLADFLLQGFHEQLHEQRDFFDGSAPIFRTEGEQGQVLDAEFQTLTYGAAYDFYPLPVTGEAWQQTALRPASIAIHNDGDMTRTNPIMDSRLSLGLSLLAKPAREFHMSVMPSP